MQSTHNTLSENIRAQSIELLNKHLAAAIDLHAQVKQAHWNVRGPSFIAIHELFDKVSGEVENYSDLIAERAGGLGGAAHGTVQVAAERSFLVPYALGIADEQEYARLAIGVVEKCIDFGSKPLTPHKLINSYPLKDFIRFNVVLLWVYSSIKVVIIDDRNLIARDHISVDKHLLRLNIDAAAFVDDSLLIVVGGGQRLL